MTRHPSPVIQEHAPPEAQQNRLGVVVRRRDVVPRDALFIEPSRSQPGVLQRVAPVEVDERRTLKRCLGDTVSEPALHERRRRHRLVAKNTERCDRASSDRRLLGRHRSHDLTGLQQPGRERLIISVQIEVDVVDIRQSCQRRQEPGGHRIRVDRERHTDASTGGIEPQRGQSIVLEQRDLTGHAHHGLTRCRRPGRPASYEQHLTELLLEALQPLADSRRRDVQCARRRVETPAVHNRRDRRSQLR